jgi:serine/threonine-protein kinase HipA
MTDSLLVVLEDGIAGTLTRTAGGRLRFDYGEQYRERAGATPLSISMPIQVRSHSDRAVSSWLWGLLPDNDAVLRRWARELHVSASSAFSLLASPIGEDCPGAVRFASAKEVDSVLARPGEVEWLGQDGVAQRLRELREDSTAWFGRSCTGRFSLAGAQAKTALLFQEGHWGAPSGAAASTHILKPAIGGCDDHGLNEHLCLDAARRAGLLVARSTLARFGDQTAVVITRYDRAKTPEGRIVRIHQEDLCQALGVPPSRKYQNDGGPGPAPIARLLRKAISPAAAEQAVWRFADALIWNWLIGGTDAHAKSYSLLLAGDQVRLAPLYGVASALPDGAHERELRLAMKLGGYSVLPDEDAWPAAARDLGLSVEALVDRAGELAGIVPDALADAARAADVIALQRRLPSVLLDLIADRAGRCRKLLECAGIASLKS